MEFSVKKYINLLDKGKFDDASQYRISKIPKKLYKFIYLNDTLECGKACSYTEMNKKKLSALNKGEFWLSTIKNLNDPFELKALFSNEDVIKSYNCPIELKEHLINSYLDGTLIGSFTSNLTNDMPMWAHYANNHRGFCIEYEINKPKFFYKVSYESERIEVNNITMNTINLILKDIDEGLTNRERKELDIYQQIFFHNSIIKHISWKNENEYRLLFPKYELEKFIPVNNNGVLVNNKVIGIKPKGIYIGMATDEKNKKELIKIANKLKISSYQMYFDDSSISYELKYKEIY